MTINVPPASKGSVPRLGITNGLTNTGMCYKGLFSASAMKVREHPADTEINQVLRGECGGKGGVP